MLADAIRRLPVVSLRSTAASRRRYALPPLPPLPHRVKLKGLVTPSLEYASMFNVAVPNAPC